MTTKTRTWSDLRQLGNKLSDWYEKEEQDGLIELRSNLGNKEEMDIEEVE